MVPGSFEAKRRPTSPLFPNTPFDLLDTTRPHTIVLDTPSPDDTQTNHVNYIRREKRPLEVTSASALDVTDEDHGKSSKRRHPSVFITTGSARDPKAGPSSSSSKAADSPCGVTSKFSAFLANTRATSPFATASVSIATSGVSNEGISANPATTQANTTPGDQKRDEQGKDINEGGEGGGEADDQEDGEDEEIDDDGDDDQDEDEEENGDSQEEEKEPEKVYEEHERMKDPRADLAIRSNDGMVFKVHQYELGQTCKLVSDAASLKSVEGGINTIEVDFNRDTIERFIEFARSAIHRSSPILSTEQANMLIDIAGYFDCPHVLDLARQSLYNSVSAIELLKIAYEREDDEVLIRQALPRLLDYANTGRNRTIRQAEGYSLAGSVKELLPAHYREEILRISIVQGVSTNGMEYLWGWMKKHGEIDRFIHAIKKARPAPALVDVEGKAAESGIGGVTPEI